MYNTLIRSAFLYTYSVQLWAFYKYLPSCKPSMYINLNCAFHTHCPSVEPFIYKLLHDVIYIQLSSSKPFVYQVQLCAFYVQITWCGHCPVQKKLPTCFKVFAIRTGASTGLVHGWYDELPPYNKLYE